MISTLLKSLNRLSKTIVVLIFLITLGTQAKASHMMGADIRYQCLGGDSIKIILTFYRDCSGIPAPNNPFITILSNNCGFNTTLTLQQDTSFEVSPLCPSMIGQSTCNGGTLPGVQEYVYSGIFVLPQHCSDWVFSYSDCCRNAAITNQQGAGGNGLYIEATLNNIRTGNNCNSSPIFTRPPVPYICAGQLFTYNHGAFDSDGDSLVYTLVQPLSAAGTGVPYVAPFTATNPMSVNGTFGFSHASGQITVTPTGAQAQNAVVAIRVDEYRNGVLIGSTMRDMQVVVLANCTNQVPSPGPVVNLDPPSIEYHPDLNGLGGTFIVCPGTTFTFDINSFDPDAMDSVFIESDVDVHIPGSTYLASPGNPATVTMLVNDIQQSATFTITLTDRKCPIPGRQILGFSVVVPTVKVDGGASRLVCQGYDQWVTFHATPTDPTHSGHFNWHQFQGPSTYMLGITSDTMRVYVPATMGLHDTLGYVVQYSNAQCFDTDTVRIIFDRPTLNHTISPIPACPNTPVCINETYSVHSAINPVTINWPTLGLTNRNNVCVNNFSVTQQVPIVATYLGCTYRDTATVIIGNNVIPAPALVNCNSGVGTVNFSWYAIPNATSYQYSLNNGTSFTNIPDTAHQVSGLANGQCIDMIVRPIVPGSGVCATQASVFHCCAQPCMQLTTQAQPQSCVGLNDGSITINAAGAQSNVTYTLMPGNIPATVNNTTYTFTGLAPGNYSIRVNDGVGCRDSISTLIFQANPVTGNATATAETCNHNGTATVTPGSGTGPFTYAWSDPGHQTGTTANGLAAGPYTVSITDSRGCQSTARVTVPYVGPVLNVTQPVTICNGDSVNLNAQYYSSSAAFPCGATTQPCTNPSSQFTLTAGTDTLRPYTGTPFNSFFQSSRVQILLTAQELRNAGMQPGIISEMALDVVRKNSTNTLDNFNISLKCTNQTTIASYTSNGMTTVYSGSVNTTSGWNNFAFNQSNFQWDGSSNLLVQICFGGTSFSFSDYVRGGNTAGLSMICGEDPSSIGCNILTANRLLNSRPNIRFTACGTSHYTWTPGAPTLSNPSISNPVAHPASSTTYTVTATDGICSLTATVPVTVSNGLLAPANNVCSNITYDGITFNWTTVPGATRYEVNINGTGWVPANGASSHHVTGMAANSVVSIQVRAIGGTCVNQISTFSCTTASCPLPITSSVDETCYHAGNGSITATGVGTGPFTYIIRQGATVITQSTHSAPTFTYNQLVQGDYDVAVHDSTTNCTNIVRVHVGGPPSQISYTQNVTDVSCFGGTNGAVQITASGASNPFTITIGGVNATGGARSGLTAGSYPVIITDANGCHENFNIVVGGPQAAISSATPVISPVTCFGSTDGRVLLSVNGGTQPYTYAWSNTSQTSGNPNNLAAGNFTVTVTDAHGCTATFSGSIASPTQVTASVVLDQNPCAGQANGMIHTNDAGGTPAYTYTWSNGGNSSMLNGLVAGTYSVTIMDSRGCSASKSYTLTNQVMPPVDITIDGTSHSQHQSDTFHLSRNNSFPIQADIANSGVNGISYQWTPGGALSVSSNNSYSTTLSTPDFSNIYPLIVSATTAGNNCVIRDTVFVSLQFVLRPAAPNAFTPNGDTHNDSFFPILFQNGQGITAKSFKIFDRWGKVVHDSITPWDGKFQGEELPRDTYIFIFEYSMDGQKAVQSLQGDVTLLR